MTPPTSRAFRTRLTRYSHDLYLSEKRNFYKLNLGLGVSAEKKLTSEEATALAASGKSGTGGAGGGGADQFITTSVSNSLCTIQAMFEGLTLVLS
jgi:hypothetical protein